jgi:mannonate dehydratase
MNRRRFAKLAASSLAFSPANSLAQDGSPRSGRMKLATQHDSSDEVLRVMAALGVTHICSRLPSARLDESWSVESLTRLRERVESFGLHLEAVPLPLSSSYIAKSESPDIMLGKSPERDREIENICTMIRNCSRAGINLVKYNLTILGVVRSERTPGRGGSSYSTFDYAEARRNWRPYASGSSETAPGTGASDSAAADPALPGVGPISADMMWERITYFLSRVVPVAEEHKVRIACHPHDPGMPADAGFRGVHRVLGSVDGLKRFIEINASPYHGLNFCQGTVSEMLENPSREIFDVIRYFGTRKKIFNVHFRNIHGGFLHFQETFPDAGDVDLLAALRVYKEVGYDGMLMPDHVPAIQGDEGGRQAFAFAFGYMRGLMQAVDA